MDIPSGLLATQIPSWLCAEVHYYRQGEFYQEKYASSE